MSRSGVSLVLCGALASACTGVSDTRLAPDAAGRSFARVVVSLTLPRDGGTTLAATGRLVRYRNLDADSAQTLAGAPAYESAAVGHCLLVDEEVLLDVALTGMAPDATVRLLDAGEILVRAAGQAVRLPPRYVPEILPFVTGVAYAAEAAVEPAADLSPSGEVVLSAYGGEDVSAFSVTAEMPTVPRLESVGEAARGAPLELRWERRGGTVDVVVTRDAGRALRCRVADTGRFVIPAADLAPLWEGARADALSVAVERTVRAPIAAAGLDGGEIVVVARDVASLRAP